VAVPIERGTDVNEYAEPKREPQVLPEICVDELGSSFTVRLSVAIKAAVAPPKTTRSLISLLAVWKGLVQMSFWSFAAPPAHRRSVQNCDTNTSYPRSVGRAADS
jgi:hypothetical protein